MEGEGEEEMEVVVGDKGGLRRYVDDGRDYIGISIKPPPHLFQPPNPHHLLEPLPPNSIALTKKNQERDAGNNST